MNGFVKFIIKLIIFIVVTIIAFFLIFKLILKMEFSDKVTYINVSYKDDNSSLEFTGDGYKISGIDLDFNECDMNYSKGYNSILLKCKNSFKLVRFNTLDFNKVSFSYNDKEYNLINKSIYYTNYGVNILSMNFIDENNIKFSESNNTNIINEEVCTYTYKYNILKVNCNNYYKDGTLNYISYSDNKVIFKYNGSDVIYKLNS